jgi:Protein of unknown function (DUF1036)
MAGGLRGLGAFMWDGRGRLAAAFVAVGLFVFAGIGAGQVQSGFPPAQLQQAPPAASSPPSDNAPTQTRVTFCNKTGAKVYIAFVWFDDRASLWVLSAWYSRQPGECTSAGSYKRGTFLYYFAEKEGRRASWPPSNRVDKTFCVPPSRIDRPVVGGRCERGERLLGFRGLQMDSATFEFSLEN